MVFSCENCYKDVYRRQHSIRDYKRKFCSMECFISLLKKNAFQKACEVCGKIFHCQPSSIRLRNRQTCSLKCRGRMMGIKAKINRIKNGFTQHQIDRCIRYSKEAEDWRKAIFARDDYTCQMCGIRGGRLEADHIKPFAYFSELRFELSNGRTLCRKCHDTTKMSAKKMREVYAKEEKVETAQVV